MTTIHIYGDSSDEPNRGRHCPFTKSLEHSVKVTNIILIYLKKNTISINRKKLRKKSKAVLEEAFV